MGSRIWIGVGGAAVGAVISAVLVSTVTATATPTAAPCTPSASSSGGSSGGSSAPGSSGPSGSSAPSGSSGAPGSSGSSGPTGSSPAPSTTGDPAPGGGGGDPAPGGDGTQAAVAHGWGASSGGDEFNGSSVDTAKWGLYGDYAGHAGNGRRLKSQDTVADGHLTITGLSNGDTGGMAWQGGQKYGRWEARMKVQQTDGGGNRYHPVLLLWPDSENWPNDGEIDWAETDAGTNQMQAFMHYGNGTSNGAQDPFSLDRSIDLTQWHNYAVEWTPEHITGFIDGQQWFSDTNPSAQPPGPMHLCIQLDDFYPQGNLNPATMDVDWVRMYGV